MLGGGLYEDDKPEGALPVEKPVHEEDPELQKDRYLKHPHSQVPR